MLRTALRPRWLALLVLVLVAVTAMARLGEWQLSRARNPGGQPQQGQAAPAPVPLSSLLAARQTFPAGAADRRVTATGEWDGGRQLLVAGRTLEGARGLWVLTPLRLPDGSAVPVVRGWVPAAGDPAASPDRLPAGPVDVQGVLRPTEPAADRPPGRQAGLPAGQVDRVAGTELVQRWPYPLLTGFVILTGQDPAPAGAAPRAVPGDPPVTEELDLRNLSYALQWWLFAAFGLYMWWRVVRDDHLGRLAAAPAGPATPTGPAAPAGPAPGTGPRGAEQPPAHARADR